MRMAEIVITIKEQPVQESDCSMINYDANEIKKTLQDKHEVYGIMQTMLQLWFMIPEIQDERYCKKKKVYL